MSNFFQEVCQLPGKEKLNVHALLITKLSSYNAESIQDKQFIRSIVPDIKNLFHNHEHSFVTLAFVLKHHLKQNPGISEPLKTFISHVIDATKDPSFQNYFKQTKISADNLDCRIARIFESNLAIKMLQNPSPTVWSCINKVSSNIIQFIEKNYDEFLFKKFLENLGPDLENPEQPKLPLAFGRYPTTPDIKQIIETLKEEKNLARIMLIHFMFMRNVYSQSAPDLEIQNQIKSFGYKGSLKEFILENEGIDTDIGPFFWSYTSFPLYSDRGRGKFIPQVSQRLGICVTPEDREEFPLFETSWNPDCICQKADLNSSYTQSLINREIPYVAGPSGMTSLLSASMLFMGKFESVEEHNQYILAIMSFIVGGGLHSIHEVLTVPHERLGLLDAYKTDGPHAGNYNDFFSLFRDNEAITQNINLAWKDTIHWMSKKYPDLVPIQNYPTPKEEGIFEKLKNIFHCCL